MTDVIVLAVVGLIVGIAAGYIYREKKQGKTCVGCPYGGSCGGNCSGCNSAKK